eukprot:jgi/Tetstr1/439170/TSEL_027621.t1
MADKTSPAGAAGCPWQPPPSYLFGNLLQLQAKGGMPAIPIFLRENDYKPLKLDLAGMVVYAHADPALAEQVVTDTDAFGKLVHNDKRGPFFAARQIVGRALFTSSDTEEEWGLAHRVLISAFSFRGMKPVVPIAVEVVGNTIKTLEAAKPDEPLDIGGLMTGITFDVIGEFGASMELGASKNVAARLEHPFLVAMDTSLAFNQKLGAKPTATKYFNRPLVRSGHAARQAMIQYVDRIISERIANPSSGKRIAAREDLLDLMLKTADPQTGKKMSNELIRQQLITFFVAGHDSTSSLLTSVIYYLTQHPDVEERVVAEVRAVLGDEEPTYDKLKKLSYTMQVMQEALRLNPPAGAFMKTALKDTQLGDYSCPKGTKVVTALRALHTNPHTWGPEPNKFNPDRFAPDEVAARHRYAWLPFSSGGRACIGMQLSLAESRVALAMILRRFTFRLHPSANVALDTSKIFAKFRDVFVTVHPRSPATESIPRLMQHASHDATPAAAAAPGANATQAKVPMHGTPLRVLYGSNMGTCQGVAAGLVDTGATLGFAVSSAMPLDSGAGHLKAGELLVVVTSTYNGTPPDNARAMLTWLRSAEAGALKGVRFALFGVGNSNWKTYQVFPRQLFAALAAAGAEPLFNIGEADEEEDFDGALGEWSAGMWGAMLTAAGQSAADAPSAAAAAAQAQPAEVTLSVDPAPAGAHPAPTVPQHESAQLATVVAVRELQAPGSDRATRHVEVALPEGVTYQAGDHLAVLAANDPADVLEVATRLGVAPHDVVVLSSTGGGSTHLPLGVPVSVAQLLGEHVDLGAPLGEAVLRKAAAATECPPERAALEALVAAAGSKAGSGEGEAAVAPSRLAELLSSFRSVKLSLADLLPLLPPLRQRYYSISSSPAGPSGPRVASVTVALVAGVSEFGRGRPFRGLASGHLHAARPGDLIHVFVASNDRFRLPADPAAPVIMVGPGTGLAPFRGFLQQLAAEGNTGAREAALFFGCRNQDDYIYADELTTAVKDGTLEVLEVAFSRAAADGSKAYVQHKLWEQRADVWAMLQAGAYFYVCGDARRMAKDVDGTLVRIAREVGGLDVDAATKYMADLSEANRYLQDVWAN